MVELTALSSRIGRVTDTI